MKKYILILVFLLSAGIYAQEAVKTVKGGLISKTNLLADKPVDVRILHPDLDKGTDEYIKANPDGLLKNKLGKSAWTFTVGDTCSWYAADLTTNNYVPYKVASKCKAVGTHCYIFVADDVWSTYVTQAQVDSLQAAFDSRTPASSSKGIYETDVATFGNPPNVDGDSKIIIFILDIKDGYTTGSSYVAGYFFSRDQTTNTGSNQAEIFYLDCNPLDFTNSTKFAFAKQTLAHEFQHMINYNYHGSSQETFLNEGCSLIAELINGYDFREQESFASDDSQYLFNWRTDDADKVLCDYSRAARFMLYYYEQFGAEFLTKVVQNSSVGVTGINNALSSLTTTTSRRFDDILQDWYIANAVDNASLGSKYVYTKVTGMEKPLGTVYWTSTVSSNSTSVPIYGAQIITHKGSLTLNSTFSGGNSTYNKIKAIKYTSSGTPVVEDVNLNSTFSVSSISGNYDYIQYLILNSSGGSAYSMNYASTGTNTINELSYDVNSAVGAFNWAAGDTVCVYFDSVTGGKIDSLKVMFSQAGTVTGGIWKYTGYSSPTPLGAKLLSSMSVTPTTSYTWTKVDLTSNNISAANKFAVAFPVVSGKPKIAVSVYKATSAYHSLTYLNSSESGGSAGWYYINKDDTTIYLYMMRAYVTVGTVGNEKIVELLPTSFTVAQNYPNPFNPSTKIQFTLPEAAKVSVRIYDMLGREIKELTSADLSAGSHTLTWNGDDAAGHKVASGTYIYAISTPKYLQTKKMVLLK